MDLDQHEGRQDWTLTECVILYRTLVEKCAFVGVGDASDEISVESKR